MKKLIAGFVVGGLLGGAVGFLAAIFVYPYIFLADIVASETLVGAADKRVVANGQFIHADPDDSIHYGSGRLTLYDDTLFIGADFEVGPGPKYHVYLVPLEEVTPDTDVAKTAFVDLGRLGGIDMAIERFVDGTDQAVQFDERVDLFQFVRRQDVEIKAGILADALNMAELVHAVG